MRADQEITSHIDPQARGASDEILKYLQRDTDWNSLDPTTRFTVAASVNEVLGSTSTELEDIARDLDEPNPKRSDDSNAYLTTRIADRSEGTLMTADAETHTHLRRLTWRTPQQNDQTGQLVFKISIVERLIGSRIAESSGWSVQGGFSNPNATRAIERGKQAVRHFAR